MDKILSLLYHGEYSVLDTDYEENAPHNLALGKVESLEVHFRDQLPDELKPLFEELKKAATEALDACGLKDFTAGYRMGVQLMMAALPNEFRRNEHE